MSDTRVAPTNPSGHSSVRVLIVEDNWVLAEGLQAILAGSVDVVGRAANATDAIELVRSLAPALVLMDVRIPQRADDSFPDASFGLATIAEIKRIAPTTRVLVLSELFDKASADPARLLAEALRAGADGGMAKGDALQQKGTALTDAIRTVTAGVPYYTPAVDRIMRAALLGATRAEGSQNLTAGQRERLEKGRASKGNQGDPEMVNEFRNVEWYPVDTFD